MKRSKHWAACTSLWGGMTDSHRQRRLPGIFPGTAENHSEQGVKFQSHIDGRRIFMGPEESMRIQSNLASTIAMAFDECIENPATREYTKRSIDRTVRWLRRCRAEMDRLNAAEGTINPHQMLFGINQGSTFPDLRIEHMEADFGN